MIANVVTDVTPAGCYTVVAAAAAVAAVVIVVVIVIATRRDALRTQQPY